MTDRGQLSGCPFFLGKGIKEDKFKIGLRLINKWVRLISFLLDNLVKFIS